MTLPPPATAKTAEPQQVLTRHPVTPARRLTAAISSTRPRQWPKNLLVFAAPLAGGTSGRPDGFWYALAAAAAFIAASSAVYLINDVADIDRDRQHPHKRFRPIAAGLLPKTTAIILAGVLVLESVGTGLAIGVPRLAAIIAVYLAMSFLYSAGLKQVPALELGCVASGFVLRVLGGASATHVQPSGWFMLVCSLGALMVAIAKRYTEMTSLGSTAAAHRPAMRKYSPRSLRRAQTATAAVMVISYLIWAASDTHPAVRPWHLASTVALAVALTRFQRLTAGPAAKPVEDLITRDPIMICCELAWLGLFAAGLYAASR